MEEAEFLKLAIGEYLLDCNAMDLCNSNIDTTYEYKCIKMENKERRPAFFLQFIKVKELYTKLKDSCSYNEVESALQDLRAVKLEKFLHTVQSNAGEDIDVKQIYEEKVEYMRNQAHASNTEARLVGYSALLKSMRKKEKINV